MANRSHVRKVRVMEVIIVESAIGTGKENDPLRPLVEVFHLNGEEIKTGDYTQ